MILLFLTEFLWKPEGALMFACVWKRQFSCYSRWWGTHLQRPISLPLCYHHLTPSPLVQGKPHSRWITGAAVGTRQSLGLAARLDTRYWGLGDVKASLKWPVASVWWGGQGARQSPRSQPEGRVLGCTRAELSPPQDQSPAQPSHRTSAASSIPLELAQFSETYSWLLNHFFPSGPPL